VTLPGGVTSSTTSVTFPGGETVHWDGVDAVSITLPAFQYWKNVKGLCGYMDASKPYCVGSNGHQWTTNGTDVWGYLTGNGLNICADSWRTNTTGGLKRSIEQNSNTSFGNETAFGNLTYDTTPENATVFSVVDDFVTKAVTAICSPMFEALGKVCPSNYSQNLPNYQLTCIYDGAALLSYQLNQIVPTLSFDSVSDFTNSFQNLGKLAETVLTVSAFTTMVSSVQRGMEDCFFQDLTFNETNPQFNPDAFTASLPGCQSYCNYPGSTCSSGQCQFSLTVSQLITLAGSSSTVHINVVLMFFIVCVLLSIW